MSAHEARGIASAVAMSLYQYNVSPGERAEKLWEHFDGHCADTDDLIRWVDSKNWATEMPYPTAVVYLRHAEERYLREAQDRCEMNAIG